MLDRKVLERELLHLDIKVQKNLGLHSEERGHIADIACFLRATIAAMVNYEGYQMALDEYERGKEE